MLQKSPITAGQPEARRSVDQMLANSSAAVQKLVDPAALLSDSNLLRRLSELGFLPGEIVTVLRRGPGGREPIAVQIGETVFALRSIEASCIEVADDVAAALA